MKGSENNAQAKGVSSQNLKFAEPLDLQPGWQFNGGLQKSLQVLIHRAEVSHPKVTICGVILSGLLNRFSKTEWTRGLPRFGISTTTRRERAQSA